MIAFVNQRFFDEDKATLQVSDLAIQRGYGVFDYFRTRNNVPLFLDDYLDRFFNSATLLRLSPAQNREQLKGIIYDLITQNNMGESGVKIILTGGYSPESYEPATPNLVILQQKLPAPDAGKFNLGIKVITHEYQRDLPAVKSINYLMGVWLQQKIREQGAEDVLYHNNGIITEFPRANVFVVTHDKNIITPSDHILHGITRKKLLELSKKNYSVETRAVTVEEIKNAAEVFMTSTTKRLLPITRIDETVIGNGQAGPTTALLNAAFLQLELQALQNNGGQGAYPGTSV